MRVAKIDIHEMCERPAQASAKQKAIVVRDARRAELVASNWRFIVSEAEAQR
jgi:hypothetical protein